MADDSMFEYELQGYYSSTYGWEMISSYPGTPAGRAEAEDDKRAYDENELEYTHRIKKIKVDE